MTKYLEIHEVNKKIKLVNNISSIFSFQNNSSSESLEDYYNCLIGALGVSYLCTVNFFTIIKISNI